MSDFTILAVDAGTSRMKAALYSQGGARLDMVGKDLSLQTPFDGASELDMREVWITFCDLTRQLALRNRLAWQKLAGICLTGQGDGCWPIDSQGNPVRNAMLWNDTRTKYLKHSLPEREISQYCIEHHVTPLFPGAGPFLLLWLKENEPDHFYQTKYVLHCKDWLNFCLTGQVATDYSDASTSLMDVFGKEYAPGLLRMLDLGDSLDVFPPLLPPSVILGEVTANAARQTNLPEHLPVILGSIDVASVAAGLGALNVGDAVSIVGTTLCNQMVSSQDQVDHQDTRGSNLCHVPPFRYLRLLANSSGTPSLDWVRKTVAPGLSYVEIEAGISQIPVGSEGLIFHPYFFGERAPFRDPLACGGFFGLTVRHTPMHLLRAAYEGLALSLYDCFQVLPAADTPVRVAGGGSKSDALCQMFADVLGRKVVRPADDEPGLTGAMWMARVGLGGNISQPVDLQIARVFEPDPDRHALYLDVYDLFVELRNALSDFWNDRNQFIISSKS